MNVIIYNARMTKKVEAKLAKLPAVPGVYFHKDAAGEIIYIGKAANLRNRVRQYFQKSRLPDPKTDFLINDIADIDWTELESEVDALFLEAELVRRYQPRYNIMLRDDKSLQFVRIDYKSDYPTVSLIRRPLDDGATYFGPYLHGPAVKKALRFLRRAFPYATHHPLGQKRASLHFHLGLDPGLEDGRTSLAAYRANLRKLMQYLRGERVALVRDIQRQMKTAARAEDFEKAATLRNQLFALKELNHQILFSDHELQAASRDYALNELANLLSLPQAPRRVEGFDVSHLQGSDTVASLVVFINGVPDKTGYRKFKMRLPGNDDYGHILEAVSRRLRQENLQKWGRPDLILIDGGKGQLTAGLAARRRAGADDIPMIGLAKRQEEIILKKPTTPQSPIFGGRTSEKAGMLFNRVFLQKLGGYVQESGNFITVILPPQSHIVKLLQRIRDESHRFAVSYHHTLRSKRQTASLLDEIPGLGPLTRKKLIKHFGSLRGLKEADTTELEKVVGPAKAALLHQYFTAPSR